MFTICKPESIFVFITFFLHALLSSVIPVNPTTYLLKKQAQAPNIEMISDSIYIFEPISKKYLYFFFTEK